MNNQKYFCKECKDGKCKNCEGIGYTLRNTYTAHVWKASLGGSFNEKKKIECNNCIGSGICYKCYGTGFDLNLIEEESAELFENTKNENDIINLFDFFVNILESWKGFINNWDYIYNIQRIVTLGRKTVGLNINKQLAYSIFQKAIEKYNEFLKKYPKFSSAIYHDIGLIYQHMEMMNKSIEILKNGLIYFPDECYTTYVFICMALNKASKYDECIQKAREIINQLEEKDIIDIETDSKRNLDFIKHFNILLGDAYKEKNEYGLAKNNYNQALIIQSSDEYNNEEIKYSGKNWKDNNTFDEFIKNKITEIE